MNYTYPYKIIFIAGLPKSGTTWVENFFTRVYPYKPRFLSGDKGYISDHGIPMNGFDSFSKYEYSCIKTHAEPTKENLEALKYNGIEKIIILYRDPRDVAISRYYHILKYPKKPHEINYADYSNMSFDEGLCHSINVIKNEYFQWIDNWLSIVEKDPSNYFVIRYEDLYDNPVKSFSKLSNFYELNLSKEEVEEILENLSFMKDKFDINKKIGQKSTFRKGGYNNWKQIYKKGHLELFNSNEKNLLIRFGYSE